MEPCGGYYSTLHTVPQKQHLTYGNILHAVFLIIEKGNVTEFQMLVVFEKCFKHDVFFLSTLY